MFSTPSAPIDRHARNPAQSSAAEKHHRIPFDGRPALHQCPDNPERLFSIRIEVVTELRPDKHPARETDKGNPFRFPSGPSERFQCSLPSSQVFDHGSPFPLAFDYLGPVLAVKGAASPRFAPWPVSRSAQTDIRKIGRTDLGESMGEGQALRALLLTRDE